MSTARPGGTCSSSHAAAEGQGGGVARDQHQPVAARARSAELPDGEIRAEEVDVGKARGKAAHHRAGAAGEVEHARARAGFDAVEDPAGEEARLLLQAIALRRVGVAVDVAGHAEVLRERRLLHQYPLHDPLPPRL